MNVRESSRDMAEPVPRTESEHESRRSTRNQVLAIVGVGIAIAFAITLYGGYGPPDWTWTGYKGAQLWDWLHVLLLPIAFGLVAVLVHADNLGPWRAVIAVTCLGVFVAIVLAGYLVPWDWTGFVGNTVWDWLGLVLLPLTLSLLAALEFDVRTVKPPHLLLITVFVVVVTVLAFGGYTQGWDWTGFEGNTLFDWLKLLFLPVVIPLVVLPVVRAAAIARHSEHATGVNRP